MWDQSISPIQTQLGPNEAILWEGQPQKGLIFRGADLFLVPFSLLWGGFACFWELTAVSGGAPLFFSLWGIPFVLVGLYVIGGRFFVDAWQRNQTYYALTNERIVILSGLLNRRIKSLNLRTLSDVTLDQKLDGRGTITFGPLPPGAWWYRGAGWPGYGTQMIPCFESIPEAKSVYDLIRTTQSKA